MAAYTKVPFIYCRSVLRVSARCVSLVYIFIAQFGFTIRILSRGGIMVIQDGPLSVELEECD